MKRSSLCLCRALRPMLLCTKIVGMFPISSKHQNNECVFTRSKLSIGWSIVCVCIVLSHMNLYDEVFELFKKDRSHISLHSMLVNIVSVIYCAYVTVLTILSILKASKVVTTLNRLSSVVKEGLLCPSALRVVLNLQYSFVGMGLLTMIVQMSALIYLNCSESYETDFDYKNYVAQFFQNITFIFYIMFLSYCAIFKGMLACLEKMVTYLLNFRSVHPLNNMQETNNETLFLGISYKLCKSDHSNKDLLRKYKSHEILDYLRCLHEQIIVLMYACNECLNPHLLCHMVVELAVLIVNYYAAVIYFVYDFHTPVSNTIHFLNCLFVVLHTFGIFIFLKNSQQLHHMVTGLIPILLEYSTRISTPAEHQQVRLFIDKIRHHRPLNASGVVNIDLSIAGPICANILTYVLVALQFDVPKD